VTEGWITGVGVYHALGDAAAVRRALLAGETAVAPVPPPAPGFPSLRGAPAARDASAAGFLSGPQRKLAKYMSPTTTMAVAAAGRALEDAGLLDGDRADMALYVVADLIAFDVSAVGRAMDACKDDDGGLDLERLGADGLRLCHPLMPFRMLLNMPLGIISIVFGLRGENQILYPGAAQAGVLLESALRGVRSGRLRRVLWGGTAHRHSLLPLCTALRTGRLEREAPADAAAFVVLESEDAARERGARCLARVCHVSTRFAATDTGPRELWTAVVAEQKPTKVFAACGATGWDAEDVVDLESMLGHTGAASLPLGVAVAAGGGTGRVAVVVGDDDGGGASVQLDRESGV
jgi:3-oxoacyl-[acyl-carrier-protein] synthase II